MRLSRAISIQPMFRAVPGQAELSSGVDFSRLRLTVGRPDGTIAYERVADFPANADTLRLSVTVPLDRDAPSEGEPMIARLALITSAGDSVFRGGPDTVLVERARPGVPPAEFVMDLRYTGPGAQATRIELTPTTTNTVSGSALTFSAQAFDAQNVLVPNAPVLFTSSDTALLRFANARSGAATTLLRRGSAVVIASLLTGPADSASVSLALPASTIAAASGSGQSALNGTVLPAPVVAVVRASDGVGVSGVTVMFAAAAGGLVANASVVSDVNGFASTTWTLGTSIGVQNLSATASGLTGSPLVFTATALAGIATQLAFVTPPPTTTAGSSLGSVTVQARDVSGNLNATFVGAVTIAFGNNPGGATLSGTTTVNAVGGVATFAGLSVNVPATGYTLAASASGLTGATSPAFNIAAGPAAALVFSVQPVNSAAGSPISPAVQVTTRDALGNTAATFTGAVTIAFGNNPGGATLSGATTVNAVAGVATFAGLGVGVAATGYTLTASASGLTGATSSAFAISSELIAWTNAAGGLWSVPANWSLARVPRSSDSVVIALPGTYQVTLDNSFSGTLLTVGGGSGTQTLALTSRTLTLSGPISIQSTGVLSLNAAAVAAPVINAGTVRSAGTSALTGALTTTAGSVLRVAALTSVNQPTLTVANGFTNLGLIEVTSDDTVGSWDARLIVSSGTLVNAPSGTIAAPVGPQNRASHIDALLNNQGTITTTSPTLNIYPPTGAVWENTGTISGSAVVISQGPSASFTNRGTITLSYFQINSGSFTHALGATIAVGGTFNFAFGATATLDGDFTVGMIQVQGSTIALGASANTVGVDVIVNQGSTVTGPGTLTISDGNLLAVDGATVTAPVQNAGLLSVRGGANSISGPLTTTTTSVMRVQGTGKNAALTVASGFTNRGLIELQNLSGQGPWAASLTVTSGTLLNASGGTIRALSANRGLRTLTAPLDNQGSLDIYPDSAGLFTINGNVTTSGAISLNLGGLTAGTQYGRVAVNGSLSLGGTLFVGLYGGYVPVSTNSFTILTSTGASTGTFVFAGLTAPLALPVTYSANAVTVGVP